MLPRLSYPRENKQSNSKSVVKVKQTRIPRANQHNQSKVTLSLLNLRKANTVQPMLVSPKTYPQSMRTLIARSQILNQNTLYQQSSRAQQFSTPILKQLENFEDKFAHIKPAKFNDDEQIMPIQLTPEQQSQCYDHNSHIIFKLGSLRPGYQVKSVNSYLQAMVSLYAEEAEKELPKIGLDLIILIDIRGSEKLIQVKKTLKLLLKFLTEQDRLCIINFEDFPLRLFPLSCVNSQNKVKFCSMIDGLQANSGALIQFAMAMAFDQFNHRTYRNQVSSMFLLSDGHNNSDWQSSVTSTLKQCNQMFTIHSFGLGQDHEAEFMTNICSLKNGSYYIVNDITMLDKFLIDALGGLISTIAYDIQIQVESQGQGPFQAIKIKNVFGDMWKNGNQNSDYLINLEYLAAGHRKDYVFELELPPNDYLLNDNNRTQSIIKANVQFKSIYSDQIITSQCELILDLYNADDQMPTQLKNYDVAAQYYRVMGARAISQAKKLCQQRQYNLAHQNIQRFIDRIRESKGTSLLAIAILFDLEQVKQATNPDLFLSYGRKQMQQISSNNSVQLGINAEFSSNGLQQQLSQIQYYSNKSQHSLVSLIERRKKSDP